MARAVKDTPAVDQVTVAICGNPNCGKTTIFNAITGLHQRVGNYPGVTVEKITGQFRLDSHPGTEFRLVDVPGSYSLSAFSPDEYIASRALNGSFRGEPRPDVIICLIDATNLERGLYLLFQVLQIGQSVVVGLNMIDLVAKHGLEIDYDKLSKMLGGLPVVPMVGSRGKGVDRLKEEVGRLLDKPVVPDLALNDPLVEKVVLELIAETQAGRRTKAEFLRILFDVNGPAETDFLRRESDHRTSLLSRMRKEVVDHFGSLTLAETRPYMTRAAEIAEAVVHQARPPAKRISDQIDKVLLHPIIGPIILIALMTLMFQSIFTWAEPLMDVIDNAFSALASLVQTNMAAGPLRSLLTDGLIGGVGSVLVFLPQIMILFLYIALLEDSGYMTRAAFIVDRAFKWCGLSGKSFIPMLSSFACAVPGIMATRTIEDRKLRIITIMVAPLMTCSARLPVYTIMIAAFIPHKTYAGIFNSQGLVLTGLYLLGIVTAVIVSFALKKTLFKTERGSFIMEMPTYKLPTLKSLVIRVLNRARAFVMRAGTIILAITIIIWALSYYPRSESIAEQYQAQRDNAALQYDLDQSQLDAAYVRLESRDVSINASIISAVKSRLDKADTPEAVSQTVSRLQSEYPQQSEFVKVLGDERTLQLLHRNTISRIDVREAGANLRNSYLARIGRGIQPAFAPLGWDWKITMAAIASFPAREVIIATLGTIFNLGGDIDETSTPLVDKMRHATWDSGPKQGASLFTPAVALSIMVFFALCCQCGATVVTIKQEAGGWKYAGFVFTYMTSLAYVGALVTYQAFTWIGL